MVAQPRASLGAGQGLWQPSVDTKGKSAPCCPERPLKSELILLNSRLSGSTQTHKEIKKYQTFTIHAQGMVATLNLSI